jgi:2-oxoglutarate ferredoxin oxidoreductase subunit alpha
VAHRCESAYAKQEGSMSEQIALSIVGSGGDGAVAAGDIVAMACAREGLHVVKTEAYGPQIRGGESSCTVRISATPIHAQADAIDAVVIFSWSDFARFASEIVLAPDALVLYEAGDAPPDGFAQTAVPLSFAKIAREAGAPNGKNIVALGVLSALLGLPADAIRAAVKKRFAKKGEKVVDANLQAFEAGAALQPAPPRPLQYVPSSPRLLMSGNEACAVAAVDAGCRFFAGYPITPSSEVLHFLGEWLPRVGGSCLQTEDELAAIGAVVGGSFAGVKSMTATSGPGLSLMTEMIGLASIAEIPAVIMNVQRGGPSTGIPTKSEQSDLFQAVYAGHGDEPRVVISCGDVADTYHATVDAFNIAEEYQVPVIVLSDQLVAQRRETIEADSLQHAVVERRIASPAEIESYRRYRDTDDGVSPMTVPGMPGGMYQTNGLEHDERGRPSSMFVVHDRMNAKRYRKLSAIGEKYRMFRRYGASEPDLGILCWGSSEGAVREAIARVDCERGIRVAAFVPQMIVPLPVVEMQEFIDSCQSILVLELSHAAQFHQFLRAQVDLPRGRTHVYARSGGKLLGVGEVIREIERVLAPADRVDRQVADLVDRQVADLMEEVLA